VNIFLVDLGGLQLAVLIVSQLFLEAISNIHLMVDIRLILNRRSTLNGVELSFIDQIPSLGILNAIQSVHLRVVCEVSISEGGEPLGRLLCNSLTGYGIE